MGEPGSDASIATFARVTKRFGAVVALDGIDLELARGEATGLLGPNGAGKSTLIKLLLGLIRPDEGEVTVFGRPVRTDGPAIRRRVGYVPEGDSYIAGATCVQLLTFAGTLAELPHREALRRAHEVLEAVGLGEARYRRVETLSQGRRVRVKIAQALVHGPDLLILDEPTAGLDPTGREQILALVREVIDEGDVTAVVCSHLLGDVEHGCARVAFLTDGRLVEHGRLDALLARTSGAVAVRFEGDAAAFVAALAAEGLQVRLVGSGEVEVRGADDARPVYRAAQAEGVRVRAVDPRRASLEELFLREVEGS